MDPVNYGSVLGSGAGLIQDPTNTAIAQQLGQLQVQQGQQNLAMQRIALNRQLSFGQDMQEFLQAPSAQGVAALFGKYPEFHQQVSDAWNTLDTAQKRSEVTQLGSIASMTAKGDINGAIDLLQQRIQADQQAGIDPTTHKAILSALQSGDPQQIKSALGMMSVGIAAAVPPDKAHDFLTGIGLDQQPLKTAPGDVLQTEQGQTVSNVPALSTPQVLNTPSGGQQLFSFNPNTGSINGGGGSAPQPGGGGPVSGGAGTPTGLQGALATVFHNEGGYNPKDMNGSPTNFGINWKANAKELTAMGLTPSTFKNMTQQQAAQLYASKYWPQSGAENLPANLQVPYFDVYVRNPSLAKSALAQSGGDPQRFAQITGAAFQRMAANNPNAAPYAQAWANRDANNMAIATGAVAPGQGGAPTGPTASGPQPLVSTDNPGASVTKGAPKGYQWNADHTGVVPIPGSETDPNSYSPQEIEDLARNWIATGPAAFASLGGGMGSGGIAQLKKAALSRATQLMAESGITADQLPAIRSKYTALNTSLSQNTQILNMLEASERALHANAQQVLQTQQQLVKDNVINNGSPLQNNANLELWSHVGSPDVKAHIKAYEDAVNGLSQEYTKFMNSANGMGGNAAPSDAARGLAAELNDTGMGPVTLQRHINQLFVETGNKRAGIAAQNQKIQAQLSSLIGGGQSIPSGAKVIGTYQGRRVIQLPNGQKLVEQ